MSDDRRHREVEWLHANAPASAVTEANAPASAARSSRPPRNYLAPSERRRLFWLVMPAAVAVMLVAGWIERSWFPRQGAVPQVDTRLARLERPRPQGDEVVIERHEEPLEPEPAADLSASLDSLARVRDATFFREADNDAWFQTWNTLRETGLAGLRAARTRAVSFTELFGQPTTFRGHLVRMRGTFHRLERLKPPPNDYGIEDYWQGWMEPAGGPASPVVVQCLTLPEGMPSGMRIDEPVDVTGYFFKNYAYNASDTIRVAPVIMTLEPMWRPRVKPPAGAAGGPGGVTLVVAATLATLMAATWFGMRTAGRRPAPRRGAGRHDMTMPPLIIAVSLAALAWPLATAAMASGDEPAMSLESFLDSKAIDATDREVLVAAGPWSDEQDRMLVRVMARMTAPPSLVASWRAAAVPVAEGGTAPAIDDRFVKITGRAIFVAPWDLPPAAAALAGRSTYDLVRIVDERGAIVDVVTSRAARGLKRWTSIDEPAAVIGLPLATGPGPELVAPESASEPWPPTPHDLLVAATVVEWYPPTELGRLGMNYGLFDGVVDGRKIDAAEADAFWGMMASARRTTPSEIARAARGTTDMIPLIDPARKWFATHRGEPVVIEGVARRATRISVDPERRGVAGDHYWEVVVFVDTPPIKIGERIQERYPVVCCVSSLPEGMPSGEGISERVRVPGFAFKRYSYPLEDALISSSQGDVEIKGERRSTPLVIGPGVEWRATPSPAGVSNLLFGVFAVVMGGLAAILGYGVWSAGRDARRAERIRRESMPDRFELPNE
ncbi:MAG: hypothetical protein ACR2IT_06630 [Pirellulales bacterium]